MVPGGWNGGPGQVSRGWCLYSQAAVFPPSVAHDTTAHCRMAVCAPPVPVALVCHTHRNWGTSACHGPGRSPTLSVAGWREAQPPRLSATPPWTLMRPPPRGPTDTENDAEVPSNASAHARTRTRTPFKGRMEGPRAPAAGVRAHTRAHSHAVARSRRRVHRAVAGAGTGVPISSPPPTCLHPTSPRTMTWTWARSCDSSA